jgi:hypothetical protein
MPVEVGTKHLGEGDPEPTRMGIVGKVSDLTLGRSIRQAQSRAVSSRVGCAETG